MAIIIKFIWRNIKKNKIRTFLILFSITLSVGLFFASMAISDTVAEMHLNQMRTYYGNSELMISADSDARSDFIDTEQIKEYSDYFEYTVGTLDGGADYRYDYDNEVAVNLRGYELNDLQQMNPILIEEEINLEPFMGQKLIISRQTAQEYNLRAGESIDLLIDGDKYRFEISAIASPQGPFNPGMGEGFTAIMPLDTLASFYNARGMVSNIFIKTKPEIRAEDIQYILREEYNRYQVERTITEAEIMEYTSQIRNPFLMMLVLVIFISVFIIYTAFKVITVERLPIIGTFRSLGATKKVTNLLLLAESFIYGVLGSVFGTALGFVILYLMQTVIADDPYSDVPLDVEIVFANWQVALALFSGIALAVLSSLLPIVRTAKISIKDIVLDNLNLQKERKSWKTVLGVFFLIISLLLSRVGDYGLAILINVICIILFISALVLLVPLFTKVLIFIIEMPYALLFGNEGILAIKNLRKNKNVFNSIALLAIGVLSILAISITSYSVASETLNHYSNTEHDIRFWHSHGDRSIKSRLLSIEGVKDVYGKYSTQGVEVVNKQEWIDEILGVDDKDYFSFNKVDIIGDKEEILKEFANRRNMILNRTLKDRFEVEAGDVLTLNTARGEKGYQIIAFSDISMSEFSAGNLALIPDRYLKQDMQIPYYSAILINTSKDPDLVVEKIEAEFSREEIWISSIKDLEKMHEEANQQFFLLLQGFALMAMLIGVFGVFNNFMVNFMVRKRDLAMLRSIGMSKWQMAKMVIIEAVTTGLIGGLIGVLATWTFLEVFIVRLFKLINQFITLHYSLNHFLIALIVGIIISVIAIISPAVKAAKLNLVEELKYDL